MYAMGEDRLVLTLQALEVAKPEKNDAYIAPLGEALNTAALALARELRRAVNNNTGLSVHYQPQVELSTGRVTGFEALMRWSHPTFGNIPPADFIPIAESSQLICDLGLWILREAAQQ